MMIILSDDPVVGSTEDRAAAGQLISVLDPLESRGTERGTDREQLMVGPAWPLCC